MRRVKITPTWKSRTLFWAGLAVGIVGSYFFIIDPSKPSSLLPIIAMVSGATACALSGLLKVRTIICVR